MQWNPINNPPALEPYPAQPLFLKSRSVLVTDGEQIHTARLIQYAENPEGYAASWEQDDSGLDLYNLTHWAEMPELPRT